MIYSCRTLGGFKGRAVRKMTGKEIDFFRNALDLLLLLLRPQRVGARGKLKG